MPMCSTLTKASPSQRGFSLIELLVVVAIIGVLAAAGIVGYTKYLDSVKLEVHKNNAATLAKALNMVIVARTSGLAVQPAACSTGSFEMCANAMVLEAKFKSPFNAADNDYIRVMPGDYAMLCGNLDFHKKILIGWPPLPDYSVDPAAQPGEGIVFACFNDGESDFSIEKSFGKDWSKF